MAHSISVLIEFSAMRAVYCFIHSTTSSVHIVRNHGPIFTSSCRAQSLTSREALEGAIFDAPQSLLPLCEDVLTQELIPFACTTSSVHLGNTLSICCFRNMSGEVDPIANAAHDSRINRKSSLSAGDCRRSSSQGSSDRAPIVARYILLVLVIFFAALTVQERIAKHS